MGMKPRVLVIDDNKEIRDLFQWMFNLSGFTVELAENGYEGIEHFKIKKPDLIFLDVNMPGMDGLQTLQEIRKTDPMAQCPVLVVTGVSESPKINDMLNLGALECVSKPFDVFELQNKISHILGPSKMA